MKTKGKRIAIGAGAIALAVLAVAAWRGWPQIRFYYLFEPLGRNAQGYLEYRHRQTGIVMVALPGGTFWMGAQKTDPKGPNYDPRSQPREWPMHEVTLRPFLIARCEVTQGQWKAAMGSNPSNFKGDDERPAEGVSWEDLQGFSAKSGLRLPTEAEWEYACRGGSTAPTGELDAIGWFEQNSGRATHPVGEKNPNDLGLHDMLGNVWEWCEDVFDEEFYGKPEASGSDPVSKSGSGYRVIRGGGWNDPECHSSSRWRFGPRFPGHLLGFRPIWRP